MTIEKIINSTGEKNNPYIEDLVNHLPMVQWAIYKMSGDSKRVDKFTKEYLKHKPVNVVKKEYETVNGLEEALGKRELYEGTLEYLKKEALNNDIKDITIEILNKYKMGISSGLFHTLIRVAYAVEAYDEKSDLKEELLRSLAYYITGYKEAKLFEREINTEEIRKEMTSLANDVHIKEILENNDSLGQRIKGLYEDGKYLEKGFIFKGNEKEKLETLLEFLSSLFYKHNNIIVLHSITSIDALITLKEYYNDFEEAVDILTTCIITHLITTGITVYPEILSSKTGFSWRCLTQKALKSKDAHDIKLTYSAYKLNDVFDIDMLKDISLKRIRHS